MPAVQETVDRVKAIDVDQYKWGFVTSVESDMAPQGLSEEVIRFISAKKEEPDWLLEWRLEAYRRWRTMEEPNWARVHHPKIDYDELYYYAAPKKGQGRQKPPLHHCSPATLIPTLSRRKTISAGQKPVNADWMRLRPTKAASSSHQPLTS